MSQLNNVRQTQQGKVSEAERIYNDEAVGLYFKETQKLLRERDQKIEEAIAKIHAEYNEKIKKIEANHGMMLVLTKEN